MKFGIYKLTRHGWRIIARVSVAEASLALKALRARFPRDDYRIGKC
mgnify:CR=1 FL=1